MRLMDAPVGLFLYKGEMCLKTEYIADWGIEAYIVSSGETFWGDAKTAEERRYLEVTPIEAEPVRHGRWVNVIAAVIDSTGNCTNCGEEAVWRTRKKPYTICPNCGAKMDGKA